MSKFYVSFAANQKHNLHLIPIDNNCIVEISAENRHKAMKIACSQFDYFSKLYDKIPNMKIFPRGIFDLNGDRVFLPEKEGFIP